MPIAEFSRHGQAFAQSLVIQKGRLNAVMIRSQAAAGIAAREISSQLKREITVFSSEYGVLEASANIAYSMAIRQISRPRKRRELDESYRVSTNTEMRRFGAYSKCN